MLSTYAYIEQFKILGIFTHLDESTINASISTIENFTPKKPIDPLKILKAFPYTIFFRPDFNVPNQEQLDYLLNMLTAQYRHQINNSNSLLSDLPDSDHPTKRLNDHLYKLNNALLEIDAPNQFYSLYYPDDGENGPNQLWGVLCLPYETRYDVRLIALLNFGQQSYSWTARRTRDTIKLLQDVNLLPPKMSVDDIIQLGQASRFDYASAITILNATTMEILSFDAEMIYDPLEDYHQLINFFILWSKAQFEPTQWQVFYTSDESYIWDVKVMFSFNAKVYETRIDYQGDWVNMSFVKLINQALSEADIDAQFYHIVSGDQVAIVACLNQRQIRVLLQQQFIELYNI